MTKITAETLRRLLHYDPDTGELTWKRRDASWFPDTPRRNNVCSIWNSRYSGKPALTALTFNGYRFGSVLDEDVRAHRAIWAIYYGEWPDGHIDHINGDKLDNRVTNLRCVSQAENNRNMPLQKNNNSGIMGVGWDKSRQQWIAYIRYNGSRKNLGRFHCLGKAAQARKAANQECGYHPNHGR